jgi:AraC-like DNA-binding protein
MDMNYAEFSCDLPLSGRISFSSPEENEEVMQRHGINQQVRQLSKGSFRADCAMLDTRHAVLSADRFNQAASVYLEPPPGMVAFLMLRVAGGQMLASGEAIANDKLVILPDGYGVDLVAPKLAGSEAVIIPKTKYTELKQVLCPSSVQPDGMAIIKVDIRQLNSMRDKVIHTMADAAPNDEEIANLVAQMIHWVSYTSGAERSETIYSGQAKKLIAKQVQAYIEEHYHEGVGIEELCRATGKEVRTLQRCFRQYFDMTITAYLKMVRLNAVYRELSSARHDEDTVASIALKNGFTHLGRFSIEYKQHFGESARETLKTPQRR